MDVKGLQGRIAAFAAERGWDHSPRILAMALAAEAGAVLGLFKWPGEKQPDGPGADARVPSAIADVLLQSFRLADRLGIDLAAEMTRKLDEIAQRYPVPERPPAPAAEAKPERPRARPQGLREELQQAVERLGTHKAAGGPSARTAPESEARPRPAARSTPAHSARAPERPPPPAAPPPAPTPQGAQARARSPAPNPPPRTPASAAPPLRAAAPIPAPSVPPPTEGDRFANLDSESAIGFLKSLSRRVDAARSDDPLLRELHDELQTLRRNLYSSNAKPAWIGTSLETIRGMLEEAARHSLGEEIRAAEHLTHVRSILGD